MRCLRKNRLPFLLVDVSAVLQQQLGDVHVIVGSSVVERRLAFPAHGVSLALHRHAEGTDRLKEQLDHVHGETRRDGARGIRHGAHSASSLTLAPRCRSNVATPTWFSTAAT